MKQLSSIINNPARLPRVGIIRLGRRDSSGRTSEVGHFLFDIEDQAMKTRIVEIYGPEPKALDVTFHTNDLDAVYTCEYQRWGLSKKRKPYLMCSGNGATALEFGKQEAQPCSCMRLGKECRKKTILRFLLPEITMGGTFLLVTKSQYSTEIIETTLRIAQRSGGLIMRRFKLERTEGFATVNNMKVKKYFLALALDETATDRLSCTKVIEGVMPNPIKARETSIHPLSAVIPPTLVLWDDSNLIAHREQERVADGWNKLKRKLKLLIRDPRAEVALKAYACERFKKGNCEDLTAQDLLILWHDIGEKREVISDIVKRIA